MFENLRKKLQSMIGKKESKEKTAEAPKDKETKQELKKEKKEEQKKQEIPKEDKKEKPSFLNKLAKTIGLGKTLSKEDIEKIFEDLEIILLENNVALAAADKIKDSIIEELEGKEVKKDKIQEEVTTALKNSIEKILQEPEDLIKKIKDKKSTYTIVFFGINGSGKTTSVAKLASKLQKENISCVLAAGDTFRAASIEQLEKHGEKLGIKVIKQQYNADPTAVAFDAKNYAKKNNIKCVLIDTAGRMYTKENLIKEMEKIVRVIQPDLKIFVGESITGNDATEQAKTFNEAIGIDGIILSKADVDEKGGTALSVSYVTNKPIYYLGTGQEYKDLKEFKKSEIIKSLGLD